MTLANWSSHPWQTRVAEVPSFFPKDIALGADDSKTLAALIRNLSFFQMSTQEEIISTDGEEWIIEGVSQGKYHVVVRFCAASYDPRKRKLTAFLALCKFLVDKSTLADRPKNKATNLFD
jgi:hypothetical protein